MARLSHADQDRLPVPGLDPGGAVGAGSSAFPGSGATGRDERYSGMAVLLFQGADDGARFIPGTRYLHPVNEVEKYTALDARRGPDYAFGLRILRLISNSC